MWLTSVVVVVVVEVVEEVVEVEVVEVESLRCCTTRFSAAACREQTSNDNTKNQKICSLFSV